MSSGVIVLLVVLVVMMLIGVPVGFALGGATMIAMFTCSNLNMVVNAQYCYSGIFSFTVMAIPFFMLAGSIMSGGGIAKRIVNFAAALIDFVAGSLGCVTILACMFFGALCGSGMATASAIGGMMIPEMKKRGYASEYAATVVCFGGLIGPIIPPSLSFVLYGAATGVSVPDLFKAGILPGVLLGLAFITLNIIICKRKGVDLNTREAGYEDAPMKEVLKHRGRRLWDATKSGIWALLSPAIILGGIYSGVFTPTEAACVSVVYSIIISIFVYREMSFKQMLKVFADSAILNGVTSFLLGYSTVFSTFLTFEKLPQTISVFLGSVSDSKVVVLLLINVILLVLGCFLDTVPAIVVMAPILLPTCQMLGVNPTQFGVIMAVNLAIGLCSPPYGCNLFVGAAVAKIKMESMLKWVAPYFAVAVICLLLITFWPALSLCLIG